MGTNYYWINQEVSEDLAYEALLSEDCIHIGKSSFGWCFSLHVTDFIPDLNVWMNLMDRGAIINEYGEILSKKDMLQIITQRDKTYHSNGSVIRKTFPLEFMGKVTYQTAEEFYRRNDCWEDPKTGLLRHNLGPHCICNAEGTYDLVVGEFS